MGTSETRISSKQKTKQKTKINYRKHRARQAASTEKQKKGLDEVVNVKGRRNEIKAGVEKDEDY